MSKYTNDKWNCPYPGRWNLSGTGANIIYHDGVKQYHAYLRESNNSFVGMYDTLKQAQKAVENKKPLSGKDNTKKRVVKPKHKVVWDGYLECHSEDYDDLGGGAFCVEVSCPSLYSSEEVRKVIKWLLKAEKWIENKERYGKC